MKKLLKGVLSLVIAASVGIPQINAATTPSYVIEVKSKIYSKQTTKKLYGLVYTEAYSGYGDANWPLVECYTPFVEANDAFIATDGSGTTKKFLIRQFGVSMGVVYWINPTQNVIHYWNTFTGEVGTDTPEKGLRGSATPTKHKGLNYVCGDIPGQSGFAYPFSGAQTGIGSVTQDWAGNIVHQWNNVSGAGINTPAQGYAVYRAPERYGQLIDFEPRLSDMTTQTMPYYRRKVGTDGLLVGSESDLSGSYTLETDKPNPNWVANQVNWVKNEYYHAYNGAYAGSKKQPVDFMGASGNLFDNVQNVNSEYFYGNWGGQIFLTYRGITFGNMFADGQYSNWYLNYDLYINSKPISAVELTDTTYTLTQNGNTTTSSKYKPGAYSFSTYSREYMFRESGVLDYFWSMPVSGFYEMVSRPTYKWTFDPCVLEKDENGTNLSMYTSSHPRYGYNMSNGYDAMNVPEIDSIKGHRVLIHNMWLQYWPENIATIKNSTTYNMRDGQIQIRSCPYEAYNATTGKWTGDPTEAYAQVGYGYGYNKQTNDYVNVLGTNFTATNTSVNCWSELERVNDNVFALYTNVPGKGFSKYYITAVEQDNPVTITGITQTMDANNNIINTISWTPQEHDRGTIHRYQVYYRVKQSGASVYEKAETIDGATQYPWTLAGVIEYEGNYAGQTLTFNHNAPYGGTDINSYYDRVYEYMVMPIYDASSHFGTESAVVTKTSAVPDCYIDGTFNQETETVDGITRYSFNVKLDPVIMAGTPSITTISRMIIEPLDATTATELKKATDVTTSAGTATANEGSASLTANGVSVTTSNNYYVEATGFTVGADGKLPSIVWHNVDPDITYNVKVYIEDTPTAFVSPSSKPITATLEIPNATLSLTEASVYPLVGDYSSLQTDDLLPLGAKRKVGSDEVTNPVTLSNANTLGTKGSAINPLLVTDEVMENWDVQYKYNIFKGGVYLVHYDLDASNVSNNKKVMWDIVGFPVERTEWYTHDKMGLSDAQKATNENITKYGYNTSTVPDDANGYTAYIDVTFTRKDNSEITAFKSGEQEASSPIVFSDEVKDGSIFPDLGVNFGSQFVPVKRDDTHWDENCPEDAENNYGYYTVYYDAFAQWEWGEYADDLNRYVGFHAVTSTNCVGHYVNNSSTWIPYYAPSVLSNDWVVEANNTLNMDGNYTDNYNGAVEPLVMRGIGYDGTANTDWSALAAKERTLPMQVHYVWGGNRVLTNDLSDRETTSTKVLMTADYPIIEFVWNGTSVPTLIPNTGDESYYTLISESEAGYTRMNMVSSENHQGVYADYVATVTGVEGILVNACGGINIYPNPVGSTFTLEAPMTIGDVKIFTTDGQLVKIVKNVNDSTAKINVEELPQGVYIVNTLGVAKMMIKQ